MEPSHQVVQPAKLRVGDHVAILSPSWAGPGVFPEVHERGLRVLREDLGLVPVEYPTTRQLNASAPARAHDLMSAYADPTIKAVMASIGGSDQITVLPHLDPAPFVDNPKPFIGYSDNTNLLNWLWQLGVGGYHGGSTLVQLARPGGVHPVILESLRRALFTTEECEIEPLPSFTDLQPRWEDIATLEVPLPSTPEPGWIWRNSESSVSGPTWGGNLEIIHWNLAVSRWILPVEQYRGAVLLLETSEEMPSAEEVFRMMRDMGERGLLAQFPAVVVAKPKSWHPTRPLGESDRAEFRAQQRAAIDRAMDSYNPDAVVVYGPDFGHTDPQYVLPYGGTMTVDGPHRRLIAHY